MRNFELIDDILSESGLVSDYSSKESKIVESRDSYDDDIYADLDSLYETAMRETLGAIVLSNQKSDPSVMLEHYSSIHEADFTEDQVRKFLDETITPIMEMSGYSDGIIENPIQVPVLVYEVASVIDLALNESEDEIASLFEDADPEIVWESEGLSSELNLALSTLFSERDIFDHEDQIAIIKEAEKLLDENGIDNLVPDFEELSEMVLEYNIASGYDGSPSMSDLISEAGAKKPKKKTKKGANSAKKLANKIKNSARVAKVRSAVSNTAKKAKGAVVGAGNKAKNMAVSGANKAKGLAKDGAGRVKSGATRVGQATKNTAVKGGKAVGSAAKKATGAVSGAVSKGTKQAGDLAARGAKKLGKKGGAIAAVTAAAIATAAAMAYRKRNAQCAGLEGSAKSACMRKAAQAGLSAAKAEASKCAQAKNPERCRKSAQKEIAKWQAKVQKYSG